MYDKTVLSICVVFLSTWGFCCCQNEALPVGIISREDDQLSTSIFRYNLPKDAEILRLSSRIFFEIVQENVTLDDPSQLARAVCRLLNRGVIAIIAETNAISYELLVSYSNEFMFPLISPALPEAPPDLRARFAVGILPKTVRAILDLLRYYSWKNIVYLYDAEHSPETIQKIYQLGYRVLKINLLGILRISTAEEANSYLRKLESTKMHRNFHVILDLEPTLAKDVIVRHVHDVHVGKLNFHFLIVQPVLEDFWTSQTAEIRAVNVTGFVYAHPSWANFQKEWNRLSPEMWHGAEQRLNISEFAFHDAALVLSGATRRMPMVHIPGTIRRRTMTSNPMSRDCLMNNRPPPPTRTFALNRFIKEGPAPSRLSTGWSFDESGNGKNFQIDIVESSRQGYKRIGYWSDRQGLKTVSGSIFQPSAVLLSTEPERRFKIISMINPPFLMVRHPDGNNSKFVGNDKFEGYCKDVIDLLAVELDFEYELMVSNDSIYGVYDDLKGEWSGIVGEIIRGKADIAVADLQVTTRRQRVVDFLDDPIGSVSLSLLMKNPRSTVQTSNMTFYFLGGFSKDVWICIIVSAILVILCFHVMAKFTGSPDNIEATSGIWGKKFTFISSAWFIIGSSLLQGTGIYPRSISCRVLSGTWWCFTAATFAIFIASVTSNIFIDNMDMNHNPQLARLSSLSFQSIITESVTNNWPQLGVLRNGRPYEFIQKSSLPMYEALSSHLQDHPDFLVDSKTAGIEKVHRSSGSHAFILESSVSDYLSKEGDCDTVSVHDALPYAVYGIALPLGSLLKFDLNTAFRRIIDRGELGQLRRKWWVDKPSCKVESAKTVHNQNLKQMSGLFYLTLCGLFVVLFVILAQHRWRAYKVEERRQRLSFEEVAMNQSLPLPPPELLSDSPVDEDSHVIDGWAERQLVPTSFTHESGRSVDESGAR